MGDGIGGDFERGLLMSGFDRRALKGKLAAYKIPQVLRVVESMKRNAMGKSELFPSSPFLLF
jgi:hypothetical protein